MTSLVQQQLFPEGYLETLQEHTQAPPEPVRSVKVTDQMRQPFPWDTADPPLQLGTNGAFFGVDQAHPESLRNVLVLGETGCGKTFSAVLPYLRAALSYTLSNGNKGSVFVVDPKRELRRTAEEVLARAGESDRLVVVGESNAPVRFIPLHSTLSMADRRRKIDALLPFADMGRGDHQYWHDNSMAKLYALMVLQQEAHHRSPGARLLGEWAAELGLTLNAGNSWVALNVVLQKICGGGRRALKDGVHALHVVCARHGLTSPEKDALDMYLGGEDSFMQFMYVVTCAVPMLSLLADQNLSRFVELDPVPDPRIGAVDIGELIDAGKVIMIQPSGHESARIAAKAVKAKVHEAVFTRADLTRPVFSVVDEFQRFITDDEETGEQAYLDRCRGYRGMVMYATQTLASLLHSLGSDGAARAAVDVLLANTPSKIIMRTTDEGTVAWLRSVLPEPPSPGPHVVDIHRPIEFAPGQAYLIKADGSWALRQARLS